MIVKIGTDLLGPFKTVDVLDDRLRCDNTDLPFNVIGIYEVLNDDSLLPAIVPKIEVPNEITMTQCQLALLHFGYLDLVETSLSALGREAEILYRTSQTVSRNNALVQAIKQLIPWTESQMDEMFIYAKTR